MDNLSDDILCKILGYVGTEWLLAAIALPDMWRAARRCAVPLVTRISEYPIAHLEMLAIARSHPGPDRVPVEIELEIWKSAAFHNHASFFHDLRVARDLYFERHVERLFLEDVLESAIRGSALDVLRKISPKTKNSSVEEIQAWHASVMSIAETCHVTSVAVAEWLIRHTREILNKSASDNTRFTITVGAYETQNVDLMSVYPRVIIDRRTPSWQRERILRSAVLSGDMEITELVYEGGLFPTPEDIDLIAPIAAEQGHTTILDHLDSAWGFVGDWDLHTVCMCAKNAARKGHLEVIEWIWDLIEEDDIDDWPVANCIQACLQGACECSEDNTRMLDSIVEHGIRYGVDVDDLVNASLITATSSLPCARWVAARVPHESLPTVVNILGRRTDTDLFEWAGPLDQTVLEWVIITAFENSSMDVAKHCVRLNRTLCNKVFRAHAQSDWVNVPNEEMCTWLVETFPMMTVVGNLVKRLMDVGFYRALRIVFRNCRNKDPFRKVVREHLRTMQFSAESPSDRHKCVAGRQWAIRWGV